MCNQAVSMCPSTFGWLLLRCCYSSVILAQRPCCITVLHIWSLWCSWHHLIFTCLPRGWIRLYFQCYFLSVTTWDGHVWEEKTSEDLHYEKNSMMKEKILWQLGASKGNFHLIIENINSIPGRPVNENIRLICEDLSSPSSRELICRRKMVDKSEFNFPCSRLCPAFLWTLSRLNGKFQRGLGLGLFNCSFVNDHVSSVMWPQPNGS